MDVQARYRTSQRLSVLRHLKGAPRLLAGRWAEEENFTLRQLVEDFAAEHEVAFLPKPGRTEGGLQVRLGSQASLGFGCAWVRLVAGCIKARLWHIRLVGIRLARVRADACVAETRGPIPLSRWLLNRASGRA